MNKLLVTAFEPFHGRKINTSQKVCEKLSENFKLEQLILPVTYHTAANNAIKKIKRYKPNFVLMLGESSKVDKITIELTGKNLDNSITLDNDKAMRIKVPICKDGPNKIKIYAKEYKMNKNLKESINFSNNAGGFICNNVLYQVGKYLIDKNIKYCFIHIPADARKVNTYTKIINEFLKLNIEE